MFTLVIGGSASGKSEYAEGLVLASPHRPRYYIATMEPFDGEGRARVAKHRAMRAEKDFETVERYTGLASVRLPRRGAALLECVGNLAANELYSPGGGGVFGDCGRRRRSSVPVRGPDCGQQRGVHRRGPLRR